MAKELDDILETDEPEDTPDVEAKEPEIKGEAEKPEPEKEEAKAKEPEPKEPEPKEEAPQQVPLGGLLDERDKRRAAEAELQQLKESLEQQKPKEDDEAPDIFEDPKGYQAWSDKRLEDRLARVQAENQRALVETNLRHSEQNARREYGEDSLTEARGWFEKLPLEQKREVLLMPDPYGHAIQQVRHDQLMGKLNGDPQRLNQVLAMLDGEAPAKPEPPTTTATARNVGVRTGPDFQGPTPLDDILGKT